MSGLTEQERIRLGVAAAQGIKGSLPVDAFGQPRRLNDYADIWGAAARNAMLPELERILAARTEQARPEHIVKAEALREAAEQLVADGPSVNGELRHDGTSDPVMSAYVEGQHDAWSLLRDRADALEVKP